MYAKSIDMRDIEDDKFVWTQHKYIYFSLYIEKDHKIEIELYVMRNALFVIHNISLIYYLLLNFLFSE